MTRPTESPIFQKETYVILEYDIRGRKRIEGFEIR